MRIDVEHDEECCMQDFLKLIPAGAGAGGNGDKDGYTGVPGFDTGGDAPAHEFRCREEHAVNRREHEECSTEAVEAVDACCNSYIGDCCCCRCCWEALGDRNL